jgi:hypothetical protein
MSKAWSRDVVVDPGTFGGTRACHVLADLMNQNMISVFEKHRVLSFLNDATIQFKWIATIEFKPVMERNMDLMLHDLTGRIEHMDYPPKFKSYMRNVIRHMYRKNLESWRERSR